MSKHRVQELKDMTCRNLCIECETCKRTPVISWVADGYRAECQCDDISMMPWNDHQDQAMMSWNRCALDNDWSLMNQRESRESIASKRATFINNMFTPLDELDKGDKK